MGDKNTLVINKDSLTIEDISELINRPTQLVLDEVSSTLINKCRTYLDNKIANDDQLYYGINTGFGYLQNVRIDASQIQTLQANLLRSHACGLGEEVKKDIVALMLFLKIKSLSFGYSGVQLALVQRLIDMYNEGIFPIVYQQGSLGASGDLAPLSHLCLPLIGEGDVYYDGTKQPAASVWKRLGWEKLTLNSKEGLALINGTQFMSAYGIYILHQSKRLIDWANLIAAIALDAFAGSIEPFHSYIHNVRNQKGQITVAQTILKHLEGSALTHQQKFQVQDPYSFRCIPQVHGATLDTFEFVLNTFINEINAVTDNPNIFPEDDLILSGGNFHGQPLALGLDFLSIAMAELAGISERRIFQLLSGQRNLPLFLVKNPGLNSGFMIPQYTAAGIVSENKQLCTPASVDSITSSNGQEDHVSMGANAATKCKRVIENVEKVLAIELLCAMQALEFRNASLSSSTIQKVFAAFRKVVAFNEKDDHPLHQDMKAAIAFIQKEITAYLD